MKLYELSRHRTLRGYEADFKKVDFIGEGEGIMPFNVVVTYDYEPESVTDHPYQQSSAREHHPATVMISKIVADEQVEQRSDVDSVIRTWPAGTDVKRLPGWTDDHLPWFEEKIAEQNH